MPNNLVTLHPSGQLVSYDEDTMAQLDAVLYGADLYALNEDVVDTYLGQVILTADSETFDHGQYEGEYYHDGDSNVVHLIDDETCHRNDSYNTTRCGDKFFEGTEDDHGIVYADDIEEWAYKSACTEGVYYSPYYTYRFLTGWVYGATVEVDGNDYLDDVAVLENHNIGYSENLSRYESRDHEDFYEQEEEEEEDEDYGDGCNFEYHEATRRDRTTSDTRFTVGFEIEKEDREEYRLVAKAIYNETGWIKEEDGSLGGGGYELVTPTLDLMSNRLDTDLTGSSALQRLVNGDYSGNCGGHINFGQVGLTGPEVFDRVTGFLPLIYAMFPKRVEGQWSRAYKKDATRKSDGGKYSAVAVHKNRIEFRVFGAVHTVDHLLWRRDLMRLLAHSINQRFHTATMSASLPDCTDATSVLAACLDHESPLHQHLRKVYSDSNLLALVGRAVEFHHTLEEEKLELEVTLRNTRSVRSEVRQTVEA